MELRRQHNGYGFNAISISDIEAHLRLSGLTLRPWELRALDAMERIRIRTLNAPKEADNKHRITGQKMTPAIFDAMFG